MIALRSHAACRECGEPIRFKRLDNGRMCPTELDGSDHFDRCSKIRGERMRTNGTRFERTAGGERHIGYRLRDREKLVQIDGRLIRGTTMLSSDHECSTPPWEECRCAFLGV